MVIGVRALAQMGLIVCSLLAAACSAPVTTPPSVSPDLPDARGLPLPTSAWWSASQPTPPVCAGVGLDAILHGDPGDPSITWITDRGQGGRRDATWPPGFRARFEPSLVVVDGSNAVVAHEGDGIDGGCVDGERILLGYR
jgi:hypothetical protein